MLELHEKKLGLMKQQCALEEKKFKILKLKEDIKRIEGDIKIQEQSISDLKEEIKNLEG